MSDPVSRPRPDRVARLAAAVGRRRDDAVSLLSELIATRSVNPEYPGVPRSADRGGETRANEVLRERHGSAGLDSHWVVRDPDRKALVGVRPGAGGGRSLLLNGHIDTVPPAKGGAWQRGDPWRPVLEGDRLYGLGATDMKGGCVAMWLAAQAIADLGLTLGGDLQLHTVPGEETGQHELGTTACVEDGYRADAAIVTEPTAPPRPLTIAIATAPFVWLRVTISGPPGHSANRSATRRPGGPGDAAGFDVVALGTRLVRALQDLEREWGRTKAHPAFPPGFFTIMPGVFRADSGQPTAGSLPHRAELHWIAFFPPQEPEGEVRREISDTIAAACRLDPWLRDHPPAIDWPMVFPPHEIGWEEPLPQGMARAWASVTGEVLPPPSPWRPANFPSSNDGIWLHRLGIPTVVFGPGDLGVAHAADEFVSIDEVVRAATCLAAFAVDWCGVAHDPAEPAAVSAAG